MNAPAADEFVLGAIRMGELIILIVTLVVAIWCIWFGARFVSPKRLLASADKFLVRRHWGGFGGDSSGWQMSAPVGACLLGLLLIFTGVSLVSGALYVMHQHKIVKAVDEQKAADTIKGQTAESKKLSAAPPADPAPDTNNTADGEEPPAVPKS